MARAAKFLKDSEPSPLRPLCDLIHFKNLYLQDTQQATGAVALNIA